MIIVDPFGGPGGWDEAARLEGIGPVVGYEHDTWACRTRAAAGLLTVQCDVSEVPLGPLSKRGVDGVIASPPCTAFSQAGARNGVEYVPQLVEAADGGNWGWRGAEDPNVWLCLEPLRWIEHLTPRWVCLEQVPAVLPLWQAYVRRLRSLGYSSWTGILCAADFGVPQTRRRAVLIAKADGPATPPEPTHAEIPSEGLFATTKPWVTMAEALGWGWRERPSHVVTPGGGDTGGPEPFGNGARKQMRKGAEDGRFLSPGLAASQPNRRLYDPEDEPAPTVAFGHDVAGWSWVRPSTTIVGSFRPDVVAPPGYRKAGDGPRQNQEGAVQITLQEALVLQSFRPDYPIQGPKTAAFRQVGNAVPPGLAGPVLLAAAS